MTKKNVLYLAVATLMCVSSLSYAIFDRPSDGSRAKALDVEYTDPRTGQTRKRFAPLEAVFGGNDQTDRSKPSIDDRANPVPPQYRTGRVGNYKKGMSLNNDDVTISDKLGR